MNSGLGDTPILTTVLDTAVTWARKYSLFPMPFGTACCAIEYMATVGSRFDVSRFGAEVVRFSPRQSDLLIVAGTISQKMAPVLKRIYDQMLEPKWVISMGVCACSGGFYDNYATLQGIDQIIPVDIYIPGCPPRPEAVIDAIVMLMKKMENGEDLARRPARVEQGRVTMQLPGETVPVAKLAERT
ncbi:MAG: NADH-quinone oxidoreductase subunit B [Candidatus Wallbacteria bacterium]|nr:NADH-quinone oxidoreductase subunit B [Candidatus Wallbacteria bacterium]